MKFLSLIRVKITIFSILLFFIILFILNIVHAKQEQVTFNQYQIEDYKIYIEKVNNLIDVYYIKLNKIGLSQIYNEKFKEFALESFNKTLYLNHKDSLNYVGLLDSNFIIIADIVHNKIGQKAFFYSKIKRGLKFQSFYYKGKDGSRRWALIKYYKPWKWYIVLNRSGARKNGLLKRHVDFVQNFLIVSFLFFLFIMNVVLSHLFKPINNVVNQIKLLNEGDFNKEIVYEHDDEIKPLIYSLEFLRKKLVDNLNELQKANENMKLVFKAIGDGYWDWNMNTNETYFSDEYYTMAGYKPGEFEPNYENWFSRLHHDDQEKVKDVLDKYLKGIIPTYYVQFRFLRSDGSYMWILGRGSIVEYSQDGSPKRMIGGHADISYLKKLEQNIKDSEEKYRTIFNNVTDAIFVYDVANGNVIDVNNQVLSMYKIKDKKDVLGNKIVKFSAIEKGYDNKKAITYIKKAIKKGNIKFEWLARRSDDTEFYVEVSLVKTNFLNKSVVVAIVKDIDKEVRAKKELVKMHKYLKNILDSMPSMLVSVDDKGVVKNWNIEASKRTGIKQEDAIGKYINELLPQFKIELEKINVVARKREKVVIDNFEITDDNGNYRYNDITLYPLIANGISGTVIRIDDITDKKRIEELLMQSEKMSTVASLAAGMAHEINNPLGAIIQSVQNIIRRVSPDFHKNFEFAKKYNIDLENLQKYLKERNILYYFDGILSSGKRAAEIVSNMLQFSRNSGKDKSLQNINDLIKKSLELLYSDYDLKKKYDFKNVEIELNLQENLSIININPTELEQVIFNIIKNGAQAMFLSEQIDIDKKMRIKSYEKDKNIVIEISDNGPGIPEELKSKIFEPFFTTKPVGVGTGLGLSISYMIINKTYNGKLYFESKLGEGTTFFIEIPKHSGVEEDV